MRGLGRRAFATPAGQIRQTFTETLFYAEVYLPICKILGVQSLEMRNRSSQRKSLKMAT